MKAEIALITVYADDLPAMVAFYRDLLGFQPIIELERYVEFASTGVRFSICTRGELYSVVQHPEFLAAASGQRFELAFPCESPQDVDEAYARLVAQGASGIQPPADMPWGQRAAFIADPEGNIHELFAPLETEPREDEIDPNPSPS